MMTFIEVAVMGQRVMKYDRCGSWIRSRLVVFLAACIGQLALAAPPTAMDQASYLYFQNEARSLSLVEEITGGESDAAAVQAALQVEILAMRRALFLQDALSAQDYDIAVATEAVVRQRSLSLISKGEAQAANSAFTSAIGRMFLNRSVDLESLQSGLRAQWTAQCQDVAAMRATRLAELVLATSILRRDETLHVRNVLSREEILTSRANVRAADARYSALTRLDEHCMDELPSLGDAE